MLAFIIYPDAKNYKGRKLLLFTQKDWAQLSGAINPHFSEKVVSPIARFSPNYEGVKLAKEFIRLLSK